jgi:MHS family proline/betaine transporter-like MFS transporter
MKPDLRRVVVASVIGNGLEWFDFVSYGYFATIIAHVFFPAAGSLSLVLTFATFAVGFIARPIGGILIGAFADRHGRKQALTLLIGFMAVGTLTLGLTPSYAHIGVLAPAIVVLGRIVQGISIGGEFASATALLVEYVPRQRRMLFGSFQMSSQAVGRVCAAGIGLVVISSFSPAAVHGWAWRLPFLIGALVGPFGFYIRYRMAESPAYQAMQAQTPERSRAPVRRVLTRYAVPMVCAIGVILVGTATTYVWNNYLPSYVVHQLHLPLADDLAGVLITSGLDIFICALGGWLADRFGAYRLFFGFAVIAACTSYPLFHCTLLGLMSGPIPGMLADLFPVQVRSTGMAISYNLAVTVFGGFAPLTITWMITLTGNIAPAFYLMAAASLSIIIVAVTRRGARRQLALPEA